MNEEMTIVKNKDRIEKIDITGKINTTEKIEELNYKDETMLGSNYTNSYLDHSSFNTTLNQSSILLNNDVFIRKKKK